MKKIKRKKGRLAIASSYTYAFCFSSTMGKRLLDISNNYARTLMLPCKNWVFWRCLLLAGLVTGAVSFPVLPVSVGSPLPRISSGKTHRIDTRKPGRLPGLVKSVSDIAPAPSSGGVSEDDKISSSDLAPAPSSGGVSEDDKTNSQLIHPAPLTTRVTSPHGWRKRPISGRLQFHKGIDYGAPLGSPVVAVQEGTVIKVVSGCVDFGNKGCGNQLGNWVMIEHDSGLVTTYGHLQRSSIKIGKGIKVSKGQQIASVGSSGWSTGPHLDFRVQLNGSYKNPADLISSTKVRMPEPQLEN